MKRESEIVIIGAGVHGASAAYHLAKAGKQVLVLEKGTIGGGASGQSGGIIRCHYSTEPMVRLAYRAAQKWPQLEAELGHPVDYARNGLVMAVTEGDAENLKRVTAMQQGIGVQTEVIGASEIARLIPQFNPDGLVAAAWEQDAGYADPYSTAVAFNKKARELGAEILTDVAVTGIEMDGATVRGVVTTRGYVRTGLVINCAGAWAAGVARMVGFDLPVVSGLLQMVAFNPRYRGWTRNSPTWVDLSTMTYCRPDGGGYMLCGGGLGENETLTSGELDPENYPTRPPDLFESEMYENLVARCPWAERMERVRSWTGPDGNSPDFHLIFGPVPGINGYLQIVGGSGNSFKLCPATGEAVAEYVTTGSSTHLDLHAFSITRFAESRPIRGRYQMHIIG